MKVIDVVHKKKYYVESWVYIETNIWGSLLFKRFSATDWKLDDESISILSIESLEEAYQTYLKEKEKEGRSMKVTDIVHNEIDSADYVHFDFGKSGVYQRKSSTEWDTIFNCNLVEEKYLEQAYQVYLKELEDKKWFRIQGLEMQMEEKEISIKVTNVVQHEGSADWVYLDVDGFYSVYERVSPTSWESGGSNTSLLSNKALEEAYQIYLKERILLKEEIMKKNSMPTTSGLYWGKSPIMKNRMFNYIVRVKGESPMLYIDWVFDRITGGYYNVGERCVDDIDVWGPKIDDPDDPDETDANTTN